jgi:AcrR family transcriptional regulator
LSTTGKSTQRDRILRGMTHVASEEGYAAATVAKVIEHAGVSRPTFYDYFHHREDCFLAALEEVHKQVLAEIEQAVMHVRPEHVVRATVAALVAFAESTPMLARMLMVQSLAGGPRALDARDRRLEQIASSIEVSLDQLPAGTLAPDISARVIVGAVERLLVARLKDASPLPSQLLEELLGCLERYEQPISAHRWRSLRTIEFSTAPMPIDARLAEPPPLSPGRSRLTSEDIEANHRRRLLLAAARAAVGKGFAATTVAEISTLAGLEPRALHRLFADKQDLLEGLFELTFQHVITVTAGAFFTPKSWPERVWDAGGAFAHCLEQNPMLAHLGFIEIYVGGPAAAGRAENFLAAFTLFVRDGLEQPSHQPAPPPIVLDLIAAATFETIYRQARASPTPELLGLLPHVTHLALAPFLGPSPTSEFIKQKLATDVEA